MTFSADITRFIKKSERNAEVAVRKITMELLSKVVLKSPVDTGRFRGNWFTGLNYAPQDTSAIVDKTGSESISRGNSVVGKYTMRDDAIYIANNLPYAYRLETGYSKQAPRGMARLSVMEISSKYA